MRESVKNKKRLIVTAIAVIIALLLSVTTGLLIYNPNGGTNGGTDGLLGNVADRIDISKSQTGQNSYAGTGGEAINNETDLKRVINGNSIGYLNSNNITLDWGASGHTGKFTGTIYGNGKTITLTSSGGDWAYAQRVDGTTGINHCMGAFVGLNAGKIYDVTFKYEGTSSSARRVWEVTSPQNAVTTFGIVCGENTGTIQNVRLDINYTYIKLHAAKAADSNNGNKIIFGGICGAQSGTLNNAFVNIDATTNGNTMIEINAKNWRSANARYDALQMAVIGGVYGTYTSPATALTTSNLMMRSGSAVKFYIYNELSGASLLASRNKRLLNFAGAIAGMNITGVRGVVWNFQGQFDFENWVLDEDCSFVCDSFQTSKVAAGTGIPTGYYSATADYACMQGGAWTATYQGNTLKSTSELPFATGAAWERDVSDSARGKIDRTHKQAKIDMSQYKESFGAIEMAFTNTPGVLNIKKSSLEFAGANDVFFRVGEAEKNSISTNPVVSYASSDRPRSFDYNFDISSDKRFEIVTGKKFSSLKVLSGQSYTGADYFTLFAAQAFNDAAGEIREVQQDNDVSFDRNKVSFMQGNTALTSFIYPTKEATIVIRDKNDNNYSYVDQTNRFAFGLTTLSNLRMDPANISNGVTFNANWTQNKAIKIKVSPPSHNTSNNVRSGIIDRIEYRVKDSGNAYTSVNVTYDINDGLTFMITDNTFGVNGYNYEIIGYKKDASTGIDYQVLFDRFNTNDTSIVPYTISNIKIDTNAPTIGADAFDDFAITNVWYNYDKVVTFDISDTQSGINNSQVAMEEAVYNTDGTLGSWKSFTGFTNHNNGTVTATFDKYAKYRVSIKDNAGNSQTCEFIVQIDKADPNNITNLDIYYFIKSVKDDVVTEVPYGNSSTKSVFARMTANFGPAGGIIQFAPVDDDPQDPANTRDTVTHSKNNVFEAEIKSTVSTGVCYAFTLISNAVGEDGVTKNSKRFESTVAILVQQERIDVYIGDINITSENGLLTKFFDKNNEFDLSNISVNFANDAEGQKRKAEATKVFETLNEQGGSYDINQFNKYLNVVSAGFYSDAHGNNPVTDANEGTDDVYYLIIEIRVDSLYDFTIRNGQEQNNYYVFEAQDVNDENAVKYQVNSELKVVDTVGIEKKIINNMSVNDTEKTYWTENPEFSVTFGAGELLEDDNIDEFIVYDTKANKESTAGRNYSVTATIMDSCRNYKLAEDANTTGYLRVTRAIIPNIIIEGELNSITCFETPNVSAYFFDVRNQKVYLDIIYKNEDREEVQFIPGKKAEIGKYFYVILLDEAALENYVNLSDPNMLIGHFNVVGDKVEEGRNFFIRDLDSKTSVIEVEFINDIIDFRSLIDFEETALRDKMQILYGAGEEEDSFINEVGEFNKHGEYIVTLKIKRDDDRYSAFTKEYNVKVIPANVTATDNDLTAPVEDVPEGSDPVDGVYFDNTVVNLDNTAISTSLRDKLHSLLTEEEIAAGGVDNYYTFTYTYRKNNRVISPNRVIDAGSYAVNLKISGDNINTIDINTTLYILKLKLDVKFDTDKYADIEGVNVKFDDKGTATIIKEFDGFDNPINISLDSTFESELRRLLGLDDGEVGYLLSGNDMTAADNYIIGLSLIGINDNIELANNFINVIISQHIIDLQAEDLKDTYQGKEKHYLWLTDEDIAELIKNGVSDPFIDPDTAEAQGINSLYFGISETDRAKGVVAIRKYPVYEEDGTTIKEPGQLGLYFPNSGNYNIPIRMRIPDPNFRIGNGSFNINIAKAPVNSITLTAEYTQDGVLKTADVPKNTKFEIEYNGYDITFKIGPEGEQQLLDLGVDKDTELTFENNIVKNAGTYKVRVSIDNDNILSDAYEIDVVIAKKKIGDKIGKFDSSVWLIDENIPNTEQFDNGIMYNKDATGYESLYSIKLVDHEQLEKEGFTITYFYDGKEVKGVTKAGSYTVTAVISRTNDADNWQSRTVELWKLDKNGDYVLQDEVIYDKDNQGNNIPKKDDEAQVTEKRRVVEYFTIAKSEDLQAQLDSDPEFLLADKETVYDGTEQSITFTDAQLKKYKDANIDVVMKKNSFIEAGEYTVLVTFYRLIEGSNGIKDKNYEPAEMEATFTIKPIEVQIFYEYGEQYKYDKDGLNARYDEGGLIDVTAYYIDKDGRKIKITSFITEKMFGSGDELDFSSTDKFEDGEHKGEDKILPGNFQMTAVISDPNYTFNEDDAVNYFRFNIKNQTKVVNTTLYILLAFFIFMLVSAGLIFWYIFRLFNPACQDIDLDGTENF